MEYHKEKGEIILNRELSNLDKLVLDFIRILRKHTDYVIISGYISILLGRSRATEDVDIFIKKFGFQGFSGLYEEFENSGFWCINAEKPEEVFRYLEEGLGVRFAKKGQNIPNFEVKFPKDSLDEETFDDFLVVRMKEDVLKISSLERHIAFKRYYLKSRKDKEDSLHIEETFKEKIDYDKVNKLKEIVKRKK